jgi:Cu+-exporting ATPase
MRNVRRNLVGACGYTALGIPVAMGVLYPFIRYLAVAAHRRCGMAFSSVTVVTNANRCASFSRRGCKLFVFLAREIS